MSQSEVNPVDYTDVIDRIKELKSIAEKNINACIKEELASIKKQTGLGIEEIYIYIDRKYFLCDKKPKHTFVGVSIELEEI